MRAGYPVARVRNGLTGLPDMVLSVRFVKSFVWIGLDQVGVVLASHGPVSINGSLPLRGLSYDG